MKKFLTSFFTLIGISYGMEISHSPYATSYPTSSDPVILPMEVWDNILEYLPLDNRIELTRVNRFFRDDLFWLKPCRLHFTDFPLSVKEIRSLFCYFLLVKKAQTHLQKPMVLCTNLESFCGMIQASFSSNAADKLTKYIKRISDIKTKVGALYKKNLTQPNHELESQLLRLYLECFARDGDIEAQKRMSEAAYDCQLGFTEKTGIKYLKFRAQAHDKDAQRKLHNAAFRYQLGFNRKTGIKHLKYYAKQGDVYAQQKLNEAACDRHSGFKRKMQKSIF